MNDLNVNKEVYDRYIDASVALFMEYYAATVLDGAKDDSSDSAAFPSDLDMRCRALIKRECARQNRKAFFKVAGKGLRIIACTAAAILCLSSVLFMTVEAVRVPIINYYIEKSDNHWEISGNFESEKNKNKEKIDITDPLSGLIDEEFELEYLDGNSLTSMVALYRTPTGQEVFFSAEPMDNVVVVDSEDVDISQECEILGCDAVLVIKGDVIHLTWIHEELATMFGLDTKGMLEQDVIGLAEIIIWILSE